MVESEGCCMAMSNTQAPVYGGSTIIIDLTGKEFVPEEADLYLVIEGSQQRHITKIHHKYKNTFYSVISAHHEPEDAQLNVYGYHGDELVTIATSPFQYQQDTAYYMSKFLVESVYNDQALDDLELIRSQYFDLSNEVYDTLDDRLYNALIYLDLPDWWNVLGTQSSIVPEKQQPRETLLHFAARLDLSKVASFLLDKPGGEDALRIPNRHGYLPHDLALDQGFVGLSEVLSEYNTHTVKVQRLPVHTEYGIICYHDNEDISLTTFMQHSVGDDIQTFIDVIGSMEKQHSPEYLRQFQTDWPNNNLPDQQNAFEGETESKLQNIIQKSKDLQVVMEALGQYDNDLENQTVDLESPGRSIEDLSDSNYDKDGGTEKVKGHQVQSSTDGVTAVLEGSLAELHGINEQLFNLRDHHRNRLLTQDVRKENLSRLSTSCPSLEGRQARLHSTEESDHCKSMLNLAEDVEQSNKQSGLPEDSTSDTEDFQPEFRIIHSNDPKDPRVQICINGVTVDSTDDIKLDASLNNFLNNYYGGNNPGVRRRRSWSPNVMSKSRHDERQTETDSIANARKSMSLSGLDGDDSDDDEETFHDAEERRMSHPETEIEEIRLSPFELDTGSTSPQDSDSSSPQTKEMSEGGIYGSSTLVRTLYGIQQELVTPRDQKPQNQQIQELMAAQSGDSTDEDSSNLTVPHSNMTKSLSTPSIPAATKAVISKEEKQQKEQKQIDGRPPSYLLIQKLIEEHDAQFRRQKEVVEDDDEVTNRLLANRANTRKMSHEVSLIDFLNDPSNYVNEDHNKLSRKEEKKRKSSVFSRFQSSYRTKKNKDKDGIKPRDTHQFVSVSFSNSTACHVCKKSMANKPAVRCENCLVNVHESSCKDQITPCEKYRKHHLKVQHRVHSDEGQQTTSNRLRESTPPLTASSGSGLRTSHSFKEKRSSSAPIRAKVTSAPPISSPATGLPLSSIPDYEPDEPLEGQTEAQLMKRRSLPATSLAPQLARAGYYPWRRARELLLNIDKAINEEGETDSYGSGQDLGHSNITESESLESLDEVDSSVVSVGRHCDDELLMLGSEEAERWSVTVDKKTLKKMTTKDIKRQDTIWELIQTERHHCRTLKILQKIYGQGMFEDLNMPKEIVERLFPRLEDLIDIHLTFLKNLQDLQNKREDRCIDEVGTLLVDQFSGDSVEQMSKAYGVFCSSHKDSVLFYKDLLARDRNFQSFIKRCNNHSLCKKREIPDFMLLVTQRLSKYPTLIEAVLKSTKDKKDRENLSTALQLSKDLLHNVDEKVDECERQQRLLEIYNRMDARATAIFQGKKFKKSDLLAMGRQLIYEGIVGYKSARGKLSEMMVVILTDLILFLTEANQKYTFFSQDNKSSVIPLFQLLVRGKDDTRDSKGIYLISQNKQNPEMYELVCRSGESRHQWIEMVRHAVEKCPEPPADTDEIVPDESEEDRKMEARSAKVREIIDQLQKKDLEIKACCDEKNGLMIELLDIYSWKDEPQRRPSSMGEEEGSEHLDALQAAIQEVSVTASRLTTMLQGNNIQLSRHVSSVGEHYSNSYSVPPVPKRAETFAGFDTSFDISKPKKKFLSEVYDEGRSSSLQNLDTSRTDSEPEISQNVDVTSPDRQQTDADESIDSRTYDRISDNGSLGDISGSSTYSMMVSGDYMTSISQLARSLHSIVHLTAQQGTALETMRAELAEANERINKLSAEVHERKGGYRHNQLEELRNLQEHVRRERQELEKQKELERNRLERERSYVEEQRREVEKKEYELQNQKEELRRQKEVLQRQIDMWEQGKSSHKEKDSHHGKDHSLPKNASSPGMSTHSSLDQDKGPDGVVMRKNSIDEDASESNTHRRSASADFCKTIEDDLERLRQGGHHQRSMRRELPQRSDSRASVSSFSSSAKQNLPMHLLSAKNEQRHGKQHQAWQSQGQSSNTPPSGVQQVLPHKLAASTSSGALTAQSSNTGANINNSANPSPGGATSGLGGSSSTSSLNSKHSNRPKSSGATSASNLSLLMKLAEPNSKGRTSSLSFMGDKGSSQKQDSSSSSSSSSGSQGQKPSGGSHKTQKSDSDVIYF